MCRKLSKGQKAAILDVIEEKAETLESKLDNLLNGGGPTRAMKTETAKIKK